MMATTPGEIRGSPGSASMGFCFTIREVKIQEKMFDARLSKRGSSQITDTSRISKILTQTREKDTFP